jgi:sugar/nucleoside kinase (ribokinase family)
MRRPEASQRNREFCTIPKALERCAAWANEKNTKLELVIGFRKTRVFQEWHAANPQHQSTILMDGDSTIASAKESSSFASPACNTVTNHPQDADNGDLIEAKKRRGVGTDSSVEEEAPKSGLLEKVLGFIHPTKTQ